MDMTLSFYDHGSNSCFLKNIYSVQKDVKKTVKYP